MNKYKIADVIVEVTNHSEFSQKLMADYEYNGNQPVDLTIKSFEKEYRQSGRSQGVNQGGRILLCQLLPRTKL